MTDGPIRGRGALFALLAVVALLSVSGAGCGQADADVHQSDEVDMHAGHDHATDDRGDEAAEADDHEGHDHATDDHGDEAAEADDHEGDDHAADDHGDEARSGGLVLSGRDIMDAGVRMSVAGPGTIDSHARLLGEVRVNEERLAHVVPPVAGTIRSVDARLGDEVRTGQLLAVIASRELAEARAAYLGARGRRELAQIDHDREKELWERDILAEQDYLDAKQALLEADIELQAAGQTLHALGTSDDELALLEESHEAGALTRLELRSPIAGTVTDLHMVLGETVSEDSEVLTVVDLSSVWVELDVPQADLGSVNVGQQVTVSASGVGVPDASGTVSFVSPVVDEETRTVNARVVLPNASGEWRPGLFVTAEVRSGRTDADVVVLRDAVQLLEGEHVVFVPDDESFAPALVVPGRSNATHVEILSGLEPGQYYVSEGAFALKAEMVTSGMDPHAGHGH